MLLFPLAAFTSVSWVVIAAYFALMFCVGWLASRKEQSARDYFLAGRSLPTWALMVSIVATTLSAATFVGVPDQVYLSDVSYIASYLGAFLAVVIVGTLFVPRLYRAGTITIYGYLRPRFGDGGVIAVSVAFLCGRLLASGCRLFLAAVPLTLMLFQAERPEEHREKVILSIALIGCVGIFYTVKGGIRAVVWTDAIQLLLVIGAAILTICLLLQRIPLSVGQIVELASRPGTGVEGHSKLLAIDTSFTWQKPFTLWACLLGFSWLNVANYGVDQDFAQRFMVSKSATRGAISVIASQLVTVAVVALFMVVGVLLWIFYKRPDVMGAAAPLSHIPTAKLDPVYPRFLLNELPPLYAGLALAGFFAVAQGSMDSAINAMASSALADVYYPIRRKFGYAADETHVTFAPKAAVLIVGLVMILSAVGLAFLYDPKQQTLLNFALGVMTYALAGMLGVFATALFTRRGNTLSCIAALLVGAVVITLLQDSLMAEWTRRLFGRSFTLAFTWWMPVAATASFLTCYAGRPRQSD